MESLGHGRKKGSTYTGKVLKTGQVTRYSSELDDGYYQKGVARSYTINTTGAQSGTTNIDLVHLQASTAVSFDAASKEIRGTGLMGVFKAAGGETIVVTGSASNNGVYTTASATADKVVVTGTLVNESAGASVSIVKRDAMSNNTVLDNNTGLTWTRYIATKFGTGGNGQMPWTGVPYSIFAYCAAANAAGLGGTTTWRVANINELVTLAAAEPPYYNTTAFPQLPLGSGNYLASSTTLYLNTANKYASHENYLHMTNEAKTTARYVLLVSGG